MKRYWKLAVLVPFIVVCIGFYYTNVSGSNVPEYVLKKQEGDEQEAAPVILHARYKNEQLYLTSEGSEYFHERPFWETRYSPKLEKLIKEHRRFMRGKNNPNVFYEDDQVLGYGNVKADHSRQRLDFRFTVSVYDKKKKDTTSFEIKVPNEESYSYIQPYDIRISEKTMKLFTFNDVANDEIREAHVYTLDLDKKNVTEDQVIVSAVPPDENSHVRLAGAFPKDSAKQSGYLVYQIIYDKPGAKSDAANASETRKWELFVYDIMRGKLEPIQSEEINPFLQESDTVDLSQSGDDLYLTSGRKKNEKETRVIKYSLTEKKVKSNLVIALNDSINDSISDTVPLNFSKAVNNRLYMLYYMKNGTHTTPTLAIAELDTGGIVYKGTISQKDDQELELNNLRVDYLELR